jgi:hypothetical protein
VVTDATGPDGAVVNFAVPDVSDGDDPTPPVASCSSDQAPGLTPGSMFPVGTTTVMCTATDPDDSPSTVTEMFQVVVRGASEQLDNLLLFVQDLPPGYSLSEKVQDIVADYAASRRIDVCRDLVALGFEAAVQRGKHLSLSQSAAVVAAVRRIGAVTGCFEINWGELARLGRTHSMRH